MFKRIWHWLAPTHHNDYRPYLLRAWPVAILLMVIVGLWGGAQWAEKAITTAGSQFAAVVSAVLVDLTNQDRATFDLHTLAVNPTLQQVAQMKANDMAAKGYFAHNSPDGKTPWYWFEAGRYDFVYAGENLAVYFNDSADVERAWMNSPGHRANLLSPHFTEIGIATAQGVYQGQTTTFVVQVFGTPAEKKPEPIAPAVSTSTPPKATSTPPVKPPTKPVATTTPPAPTKPVLTLVKGESTTTDDTLTVLYEDDEFIAVVSTTTTEAPSEYAAEPQSDMLQRLIASPNTTLSYIYGAIAALLILALVFLIFFEIRKQRPMNILFAVLLIALILLILYASKSHVVVESARAVFLGQMLG